MHEQSSLESEVKTNKSRNKHHKYIQSSATINDLLDKNGQLAQQIAGFNKITDENDMVLSHLDLKLVNNIIADTVPLLDYQQDEAIREGKQRLLNLFLRIHQVKMQQENENEEMRATLERVATRNKEV